ncbi:MAG: 4Fe-4S dicluster domain-containing protein [Acidobacteriia bacterium]|nr:4Fe-4S dicluster domain-containing protein [Terriglobia bacterium]
MLTSARASAEGIRKALMHEIITCVPPEGGGGPNYDGM